MAKTPNNAELLKVTEMDLGEQEAARAGYEKLRAAGEPGLLDMRRCIEVGRYGREVLTSRVWDRDDNGFAVLVNG